MSRCFWPLRLWNKREKGVIYPSMPTSFIENLFEKKYIKNLPQV
jgi:hypothetical protein